MKRILSLILICSLLCICVCLASCGSAEKEPDASQASSVSSVAPPEPLPSPESDPAESIVSESTSEAASEAISEASAPVQPVDTVCTVDEAVWKSALAQNAILSLPNFSILWESKVFTTNLSMTMSGKFTPSAVLRRMTLLDSPLDQLLLDKDGKGKMYTNVDAYGWAPDDGYDSYQAGYQEMIARFFEDDLGEFALLADRFSLFTFDEASQTYVAKGVSGVDSGDSIDWTVRFADGKLCFLEASVKTDLSESHVRIYDVGSTEIDIPDGLDS